MPIRAAYASGDHAKGSETVTLGRFRFAVAWRATGARRGPVLHVFGPVSGRGEEVLRFDCLDQAAHYHLGWSYRDEPMVPICATDPFDWALGKLSADLNALLRQAQADGLNAQEMDGLEAALAKVRAIGHGLKSRAAREAQSLSGQSRLTWPILRPGRASVLP